MVFNSSFLMEFVNNGNNYLCILWGVLGQRSVHLIMCVCLLSSLSSSYLQSIWCDTSHMVWFYYTYLIIFRSWFLVNILLSLSNVKLIFLKLRQNRINSMILNAFSMPIATACKLMTLRWFCLVQTYSRLCLICLFVCLSVHLFHLVLLILCIHTSVCCMIVLTFGWVKCCSSFHIELDRVKLLELLNRPPINIWIHRNIQLKHT